jgi:hypothetical protein
MKLQQCQAKNVCKGMQWNLGFCLSRATSAARAFLPPIFSSHEGLTGSRLFFSLESFF